MAVRNLHELFMNAPTVASEQSVAVLAALFDNPRLIAERQGLFLFREAAGALLALYVGDSTLWGDAALHVLYGQLRHGFGAAQRAVCENLAGLPVSISAPTLPMPVVADAASQLDWSELHESSLVCSHKISFVGRSLVAPLIDGTGLLVVKFARNSDDSVSALAAETQWLFWLQENNDLVGASFAVPRPLSPHGGFLFRLGTTPVSLPPHLELHQQRYAIAFIAPPDYYWYLNEPGGVGGLVDDHLSSLLAKNAEVLGRLAGTGVIHDALIPLFHNRVQRNRREDGGYYDWALGGRLDRWLESCRHPNLGVGGPRDFEHLVVVDGQRGDFYQQLGAHFLSMLLVAASYFRNKAPELKGQQRDGTPVDARHLFDVGILSQAIREMYSAYYRGFTGLPAMGRFPFDADLLARRMIEEMGVDHHMEEVLRVIDQTQMDDAEFINFLRTRGHTAAQAVCRERGREDIVLLTGPHLGGFNQSISLPEMVEAVGAMAAMCVLGRYRAEQDCGVCPSQSSVREALAVATR